MTAEKLWKSKAEREFVVSPIPPPLNALGHRPLAIRRAAANGCIEGWAEADAVDLAEEHDGQQRGVGPLPDCRPEAQRDDDVVRQHRGGPWENGGNGFW